MQQNERQERAILRLTAPGVRRGNALLLLH